MRRRQARTLQRGFCGWGCEQLSALALGVHQGFHWGTSIGVSETKVGHGYTQPGLPVWHMGLAALTALS